MALNEVGWNILGLVVAAAGLAVSVILFFLSRQRKALAWHLSTLTQLLNSAPGADGRLTVFFDGRAVQNPELALIQVHNKGNLPLQPQDFLRPVTVGLQDKTTNACIVSAEVADRKPTNLDISLDVQSGLVQVAPFLLNPKESFTLRLIGTRLKDNLNVEARVVGVSGLPREPPAEKLSIGDKFVACMISVAPVFALFGLFGPPKQSFYFAVAFITLLVGTPIVYLVISTIQDWRRQRMTTRNPADSGPVSPPSS